MIDHYDWPGGREAMLRFGPAHELIVIVAMPLFEEANRCRRLAVSILRALAERGIGGALPDLPGQNESLAPTDQATLRDWRTAFSAAAAALGTDTWSVALRGGALVDEAIPQERRWRLAPISGASVLKDLRRASKIGSEDRTSELAGNRLSPELIAEMTDAMPAPGRTVRLVDDPLEADIRIDGSPLWRRAEPAEDAVLVEGCAQDISEWIASCGG